MQQLTTQYEETQRAAAAYSAYEAMGPNRSLEKLLATWQGSDRKVTARLRTLYEWSRQNQWVARCQQYDMQAIDRERKAQVQADEARAKRKAEREAKREIACETMDDERADLMRATWRKTLKTINEKLEAPEPSDDEIVTIKRKRSLSGLVGLVSLLKMSMDEERLARGGATAINEQRVTGKDGAELTGLTIITVPITIMDEGKYVRHGTRSIVDADET